MSSQHILHLLQMMMVDPSTTAIVMAHNFFLSNRKSLTHTLTHIEENKRAVLELVPLPASVADNDGGADDHDCDVTQFFIKYKIGNAHTITHIEEN